MQFSLDDNLKSNKNVKKSKQSLRKGMSLRIECLGQ